MVTFYYVLAMGHDWLPNVGEFDNDVRQMSQPGDKLVALPHEVREAIKKIRVFAVLRKHSYEAILCFLAFLRAEEAPWSDDCSIGWFSYSWNTA